MGQSTKAGAEISAANMKKVQAIHDHSADMGASCAPAEASKHVKYLMSMDAQAALDYSRSEISDIMGAADVLRGLAIIQYSEINETVDRAKIIALMRGTVEFISGEIDEMEASATQADILDAAEDAPEMLTVDPMAGKAAKNHAQLASRDESALNLSYAKSVGSIVTPTQMAVKFVGKNEIRHPVFLWGDAKSTDLEREFFTRETDFWDAHFGKATRPLTWDHGQDNTFDADPVIGKTVSFEDDEIGRWAISQLDTAHKYRSAIDVLIKAKSISSAGIALPVIGPSSDSAPQYVKRVQVGKSTWLARWPWFATALTPSPCEPRMISSDKGVEFLKAWGINLPDAPNESARQNEINLLQLRERELQLKSKLLIGGL